MTSQKFHSQAMAMGLVGIFLILVSLGPAFAGMIEKTELVGPGIWCDQLEDLRFGHGVAVGDLDGDGFDDVAVAGYGAPGLYGPVELFYGQASGYPQDAGGIDFRAETMAILDLNADGYDDLALGYFGSVYIYLGGEGSDRLPPPPPQTPDITLPDLGNTQTLIVNAGDRNGDGIEDLFVGLSGTIPRAHLFYGFDHLVESTPDGPHTEVYEYFLRSLNSVGDVNDDGCADYSKLIPDDGSGEPAVKVFSGSDRRRAWACGDNLHGQLGDGTITQRLVPTAAGTEDEWTKVVVGTQHTLALASDGSLWAWGGNSSGQLGDGTNTDRYSPTHIQPGVYWTDIAAGTYHSLAVRDDGTLWAWGANNAWQLGRDGLNSSSSPLQVGVSTNWIAVGAGRSFSLGIWNGGLLFAWGQNNHGQLGIGNTINKSVPTQVAGDKWAQVDGGQYHTLARQSDGSIYGWGNNSFGEVGDGTTIERHTPVQITTFSDWVSIDAGFYSHYSMALRSDATLYSWGSTGDPTPTKVGTDKDWLAVSAGYAHVTAIKNDGTLWAWGSNYYGQLGDGSTVNIGSPTMISSATDWAAAAAGVSHTVTLRNPDYGEWQVSGLAGETSTYFGDQVASAGDINGDGIGDLFVTDPWYDGGSPGGYGYWGRVHVWFGGTPSPADPLGLGVGENPVSADVLLPGGYAAGAHRFVAAGDIDGDGAGDLAVGDQRAALQCFIDDTNTNIVESGMVTIYLSDAVISGVDLPVALTTRLHPCRPNPFNPRTTIKFELPAEARVSINVYDTAGRRVKTLLEGVQSAGAHEVTFKADRLGSGVYFYEMRAGNFREIRKMTLVK